LFLCELRLLPQQAIDAPAWDPATRGDERSLCSFGTVIYDDVIMRTIVDLPDEQVKALARLCESRGISRAEAVRRAVARLLADEQRPGREQAFGAWSGKGIKSTTLIRELRAEWEA
jgi:Arc/MetJ-type ribon-helix-helix transcriptional regulator